LAQTELIGKGWTFPVGVNGSGGIALSTGTDEIDESIAIIVGTALGERVMRPDFGCRIHELIFAPLNGDTMSLARRYVEEALGWWEPRIDVRSIDVEVDPREPQRNKLLVTVSFVVRATHDERALVYPFYLIREE
jgi:hypothetical protein